MAKALPNSNIRFPPFIICGAVGRNRYSFRHNLSDPSHAYLQETLCNSVSYVFSQNRYRWFQMVWIIYCIVDTH